ncbi:enoyl-CoA hydratase [Aeromicrobium sp. CF3.5]|uniref:enoyl-CoA hydratase n=1 Tax=Aeromicrobium sp. CF3.5 TaxID=3373078 RepID=UPI003EE587CB
MTDDQNSVLTLDHDGDVATLVLRRPDRRNALNVDLCRALHAGVDDAIAAGARALVITGEGTAFCAGADLDGVYGGEFLEALYGMLHHLTQLPVPIVAAVNGPAIGAGTQLAMACDLRVADETARFGVPTARNGMAVDAWTIRTLEKLAGGGPARRIMLGAELLDQTQALDCGLADRAGAVQTALDWAQEIAAFAPLTLAHNKMVLNGAPGDEAAVEASFAHVWASADVREAQQARADKRTPVFVGE